MMRGYDFEVSMMEFDVEQRIPLTSASSFANPRYSRRCLQPAQGRARALSHRQRARSWLSQSIFPPLPSHTSFPGGHSNACTALSQAGDVGPRHR